VTSVLAAARDEDRNYDNGGWIRLNGMISAIRTLQVAVPMEYFGQKTRHSSNGTWRRNLLRPARFALAMAQ